MLLDGGHLVLETHPAECAELMARFVVDIDCWGQARGQPIKPGALLEVIRQNPGISVTELARELKMRHPNYLYRVLPQLESQGAVRKDGTGWHAA